MKFTVILVLLGSFAAQAASFAAEAPVVPESLPQIDPASVTLFPEQGRLEMRGLHLKGLQVSWSTTTRSGDLTDVDSRRLEVVRCEAERACFRPRPG
jgi:hypothetical protein